MAQPAGPVTAHAFERMSATLVDGYRRSGADVIFVELHGAMVADGYDDAEGELLRRIRAVVGPDVRSSERSTCTSTCRTRCSRTPIFSPPTAPIRMSTGARPAGASRAGSTVCGVGNKSRQGDAAHAVPDPGHGRLLDDLAGEGTVRTLEAIEAETGVHLNFTPGFPPADIADCGPAVFGYGADQATVQRAVDRLADAVIAAEPAFAAQRVQPVAEAVANAIRIAATAQQAGRPRRHAGQSRRRRAVQHHRHHRRTAGARRAKRRGRHPARSPDVAAAAHAAGVGAHLNIPIGGGLSGAGQTPQPGPWTVVALSDGAFEGTSPMLRSKTAQMGKTAVLKQNGVEVLVASIRQQPIHRETFSHLGVDPRERQDRRAEKLGALPRRISADRRRRSSPARRPA